ncbi:hypothetical protein GB937_004175 [Aspergillus fischeri]|nr:hypothetical protein GB937_004175 [Aspergillus fischeri]
MSHQTLESIQIRSIANDLHVWLAISAKPPERGLSSTPQRITPTRVGALLEDRHANEIPSFSPRSEPFKLQLPTRLSNEDEDRLFRERGKRTGGTAVIKVRQVWNVRCLDQDGVGSALDT